MCNSIRTELVMQDVSADGYPTWSCCIGFFCGILFFLRQRHCHSLDICFCPTKQAFNNCSIKGITINAMYYAPKFSTFPGSDNHNFSQSFSILHKHMQMQCLHYHIARYATQPFTVRL